MKSLGQAKVWGQTPQPWEASVGRGHFCPQKGSKPLLARFRTPVHSEVVAEEMSALLSKPKHFGALVPAPCQGKILWHLWPTLIIIAVHCTNNQTAKGPDMDVIFNCPKCDQELEVDASGAGSEIECPSCGETIVIPAPAAGARVSTQGDGIPTVPGTATANPIASSAAAKVELHLKVPQRKAPESLIGKPLAPLEAAAKETDKKMRVKTIKHTDCVEVGHDRFDEVVTNFLQKVGEANIISVTTISYSHLDIGTQKLLDDFGVMIIYRG